MSDEHSPRSAKRSFESPLALLVFGAGCFWGAEELIRQVPGVVDTEVGYAGGELPDPTYQEVCTGRTGHAEVVQVTYDPSVTSFAALLSLFFRLHNPTTRNQQGNDVGTQYRSVIFYKTDEELEQSQKAIVEAQKAWDQPIVTSLERWGPFYPAETEHQDYLQKNPHGYTCHYWRN